MVSLARWLANRVCDASDALEDRGWWVTAWAVRVVLGGPLVAVVFAALVVSFVAEQALFGRLNPRA